ncbi:hypothetical protein QJS66_18890 [Kocuria rhizophila]|nr:hypothetical protein QJS66_18890 [Kocuria rhizophila]
MSLHDHAGPRCGSSCSRVCVGVVMGSRGLPRDPGAAPGGLPLQPRTLTPSSPWRPPRSCRLLAWARLAGA